MWECESVVRRYHEPHSFMTSRTLLRTLLAGLGATLIGSGCAPDRATAPAHSAPAAAAELSEGSVGTASTSLTGTVASGTDLVTAPVVQRANPLEQDESVTQTIGPEGGTIRIPDAGLTVVFTPGAVSAPTSITATANAGTSVAYSFEPHGLQFQAAVRVTQDLLKTALWNQPSLASTIAGAYMPGGVEAITDGTAEVSEFEPTETEAAESEEDGTVLTQSTFNIRHFSGYILTGGRR